MREREIAKICEALKCAKARARAMSWAHLTLLISAATLSIYSNKIEGLVLLFYVAACVMSFRPANSSALGVTEFRVRRHFLGIHNEDRFYGDTSTILTFLEGLNKRLARVSIRAAALAGVLVCISLKCLTSVTH